MKQIPKTSKTFSLDDLVRLWHQAIEKKDFETAKAEARKKVNQLKLELTDHKTYSEDQLNLTYVIAVFFRGLYDFAKLQQLTSTSTWIEEPKLLERIWGCLWDCSDRIGFCLPNLEGPGCDRIIKRLCELRSFYHERFGPGLYCSPDILVKRQTCTICGKDFRACDHIAGRLYKGQLCRPKVEDFELRSSSIVEIAQDPRCRIWPWNLKNDRTFTSAIMTLSTLDDFMTSDDWK